MIALRRLLRFRRVVCLGLLGFAVLGAGGCERLAPLLENKDGARDQAEQKQAAGDYPGAIASYEKSFDGTPRTAEAHFRAGLIYDEKLHDTLGAVYQFRRYLALTPNGPHARDAQNNLNRLEMTLATSLSGGTLISHAEALRLRNENLDLRKQVATLTSNAMASGSTPADTTGGKLPPGAQRGRPGDKKLAPGSHTYQVQPGDTFASISRKFYKTKVRAKDIQDANQNAVPDPAKLKPGTTIIIP